jgi:hypothetical protein
MEGVADRGGPFVQYTYNINLAKKLESRDVRFPLGFLHTPQLIAKYIVHMKDTLKIKVDINVER